MYSKKIMKIENFMKKNFIYLALLILTHPNNIDFCCSADSTFDVIRKIS